ncbi:dodecin [Brachybacterium sp. AOP43-C2-M15]|uniref:dodecin n=1 Tax=Brachybacterium sp. AOP43-C2-M15 TaxID=3457661 RepID=UPI004034EAD8
MAGHVYNVTEIVGTSPESTDDAVKNALAEASRTLRNLDWFEVQSTRGHIVDGYVADWQVTIKIGFRHES